MGDGASPKWARSRFAVRSPQPAARPHPATGAERRIRRLPPRPDAYMRRDIQTAVVRTDRRPFSHAACSPSPQRQRAIYSGMGALFSFSLLAERRSATAVRVVLPSTHRQNCRQRAHSARSPGASPTWIHGAHAHAQTQNGSDIRARCCCCCCCWALHNIHPQTDGHSARPPPPAFPPLRSPSVGGRAADACVQQSALHTCTVHTAPLVLRALRHHAHSVDPPRIRQRLLARLEPRHDPMGSHAMNESSSPSSHSSARLEPHVQDRVRKYRSVKSMSRAPSLHISSPPQSMAGAGSRWRDNPPPSAHVHPRTHGKKRRLPLTAASVFRLQSSVDAARCPCTDTTASPATVGLAVAEQCASSGWPVVLDAACWPVAVRPADTARPDAQRATSARALGRTSAISSCCSLTTGSRQRLVERHYCDARAVASHNLRGGFSRCIFCSFFFFFFFFSFFFFSSFFILFYCTSRCKRTQGPTMYPTLPFFLSFFLSFFLFWAESEWASQWQTCRRPSAPATALAGRLAGRLAGGLRLHPDSGAQPWCALRCAGAYILIPARAGRSRHAHPPACLPDRLSVSALPVWHYVCPAATICARACGVQRSTGT